MLCQGLDIPVTLAHMRMRFPAGKCQALLGILQGLHIFITHHAH